MRTNGRRGTSLDRAVHLWQCMRWRRKKGLGSALLPNSWQAWVCIFFLAPYPYAGAESIKKVLKEYVAAGTGQTGVTVERASIYIYISFMQAHHLDMYIHFYLCLLHPLLQHRTSKKNTEAKREWWCINKQSDSIYRFLYIEIEHLNIYIYDIHQAIDIKLLSSPCCSFGRIPKSLCHVICHLYPFPQTLKPFSELYIYIYRPKPELIYIIQNYKTV